MKFVKIKPKEIPNILVNPGMGWAVLQEGSPLGYYKRKVKGYPEASIAYFRHYWDEFEPEEGAYQFQVIDDLLEKTYQDGRRCAFRVAPFNHSNPDTLSWLRKLGCRGFIEENIKRPGNKFWRPDYNDPIFLSKMSNIIHALGKRYNSNPQIDHIDIGSLGYYGEWSHMPDPQASLETKKFIVDIYMESFPDTPLIAMIGHADALGYAVSKNAGWRADCLGDMRDKWNQMENMYLQHLVAADALAAWKTAPVIFEPCWTMQKWKEMGFSADYILTFALAMHASVINNKNSPVPPEWQPIVKEFSRKIGYRLVLKEIKYPQSIQRRNDLPIQMVWENKGVAPCYRRYPLAFRLRRNTPGRKTYVIPGEADIRKWLPGCRTVEEKIAIPVNIPKGDYDLNIAILDQKGKNPVLKLAIAGLQKDGWYSTGKVVIH